MLYAQFFDVTLHYVGPFETKEAADAHAAACAAAGDGAEYRDTIPVADADPAVDVDTPERDLYFIQSAR